MGNRISGFVVTFDSAVSEQYMDKVQDAVKLFEGVILVDPIVEDIATFMGASQESTRIKKALLELLKSDFNKK